MVVALFCLSNNQEYNDRSFYVAVNLEKWEMYFQAWSSKVLANPLKRHCHPPPPVLWILQCSVSFNLIVRCVRPIWIFSTWQKCRAGLCIGGTCYDNLCWCPPQATWERSISNLAQTFSTNMNSLQMFGGLGRFRMSVDAGAQWKAFVIGQMWGEEGLWALQPTFSPELFYFYAWRGVCPFLCFSFTSPENI